MALVEQYTPDPSLDPRLYEEFLRLSEKVERLASSLDTFLGNGLASVATLTDSGSWTPVLVGAGSPTYVTQYGYFTRVGRLVTLVGKINVTGATLNALALQISGLPFPVYQDGDPTQRASCVVGGDWAALGTAVDRMRLRTGGPGLQMVKDDTFGSSVYALYNDFSSTGFRFNFSISYICEALV